MASLLVDRWPELPLAAWRDTRDTLHLWAQVVGKVRLALTPWLNHSWHVALYVTARGLTTSPMPCEGGSLEIEFDFVEHVVWLRLSNGDFRKVTLRPMSVAAFYAEVRIALNELGLFVTINPMPCEIPGAIPFGEDDVHKSYDPEYARRFFRVLTSAHEVMSHFRTGVSRQIEPGAFLLGQFRSGRDAIFRPNCAAPSWWRAAPAGFGRAGGLFARGFERRLLAGWRGRAGR